MITISEHVLLPDGDVRLTLRVSGPLDEPWTDVLPATGGALVLDGDDVLVSWVWPRTLAPPEAPAICARLITSQITEWAARWVPATPSGPSGLTLSEPGTIL